MLKVPGAALQWQRAACAICRTELSQTSTLPRAHLAATRRHNVRQNSYFHPSSSSHEASTSALPSSDTDGPSTGSLKRASSSYDVGSQVSLGGWLISIRRISSTLTFATLLLPRGRGKLQLVARSEGTTQEENSNVALWQQAGVQGAVHIEGILSRRPPDHTKQSDTSDNPFGQFECTVRHTRILNEVAPGSLPFNPHSLKQANEETRMRYRYLDLRRDELGRNIRLRSKVSWAIRSYLHDQDFTEIETPILLKSSPEGAREYLVPTRRSRQGRSSASKEKITAADDAAAAHRAQQEPPLFFALQQSPQQPKQLLIASGVTDRYFQFAKCFRDEDGRKDRQAEFTQIDLEMGFVASSESGRHSDWSIGGHEIREVIEGMIKAVWSAAADASGAQKDLQTPFRVMRYEEAMRRYGSDKPDLRFGLELVDLGDVLRCGEIDAEETDWRPFHSVEMLCYTPPKASGTHTELQKLLEMHQDRLAGVETFRIPADNVNTAAKLLLRKSGHVRDLLAEEGITAEEVSVERLTAKLEEAMEKGRVSAEMEGGEQTYVFLSRKILPDSAGSTKLGELRRMLLDHLMSKGQVEIPSSPCFVWIIEFPLFTRTDTDKAVLSKGRWNSSHHPFTSPGEEDIPLLREVLKDSSTASTALREKIMHLSKGQHYDLVLNGVEIGGGSVRIHSRQLQELILRAGLELTDEEISRFSHLLDALGCGAPPHAGIALGFDRLMTILCTTNTIRDVIAFPKSANGRDLLFGSPASVDASTTSLEDYGLQQYQQD